VAGENRSPAAVKRSAFWRRTASILALATVLLLVVVYVARTFVFARLAEIYLLTRGVPSSVTISRIDWNGLDASARLGARRTPDLSIGHLQAVFSGGWIPQLRALTISHATLRLAYDGEKLSFGTLQRLVDSTAVPATHGAPGTEQAPSEHPVRITLQDAKLLAFTPAGVVSAAGSGSFTGGRIDRLSGNIGRASLRDSGFALLLSGGSFSVRSDTSGLAVYTRLSGRGLRYKRLRAGEVQTMVSLHGLALGGGSYLLSSANAVATAQFINGSGFSAARADAHVDLGSWTAIAETTSGPVEAVIELGQLKTKEAAADKIALHLQSQTLKMAGGKFSGPVEATTEIAGGRYRVKAATLLIPTLVSQAKGEVSVGDDYIGSLTASLNADLAMSPADARRLARSLPLAGDDTKVAHATAAALRSGKLQADDIYIGKSSRPLLVSLQAPVTFASRSGARTKISQSGDSLLSVDSDNRMTGGFAAVLSGGGLPRANLDVLQFDAREENDGLALDSTLSLSARANLRTLRDATIVTKGKLNSAHGRIAYVPDGCVRAGFGAYMSRGAATLSDLRAELCAPSHASLLTSTADGWTLDGTWRNFAANVDAANARAVAGSGKIRLTGSDAGLANGFVDAPNLRLSDVKLSKRFAPLIASGRLVLTDGQWRGNIGLVIAKTKRTLATIALHHDMKSASGDATIVSDMALAPDGFQPGELSPLLASLTQAKGNARFRGHLVWTADGMTSGGTLVINDADFAGPLGTVRNAATEIAFTSLTPLATAPAQQLTAAKIEWLMPFSNLVLRFQLDEEAIRLEDFDAAAAGGHVELAPMKIALDPKATIAGSLKLSNVNLSALIAASNLSDKVSLDAPVSGTIPFRYGPKGLRVTDGYFASTAPARLSIRRTVWTGGAPEQQTDAIHDFAYQALENLAIDELDAKLNSLPAGRLGVVFHIKGRNDPAVAKETRISLIDLVQGRAFDKPVPLPKGTPVDLTLDTSLNFDELLDAYRHAFSADLAEAAATSEQDEGMTP